jgi:hypothetical protein
MQDHIILTSCIEILALSLAEFFNLTFPAYAIIVLIGTLYLIWICQKENIK